MDTSPVHSSAATSPLPGTFPDAEMCGAAAAANCESDNAPQAGASSSSQDDPDTGMTSDGNTADFVEMDNDLAHVSLFFFNCQREYLSYHFILRPAALR